MSTFFEKLTAANASASEDELPEEPTAVLAKSGAAATRRTRDAAGATHLSVEEDASAPGATSEEDEGELTVDIFDQGDAIVIQSTVAGVKPEDLDISITHEAVTIRGRRERQEEVGEPNYYYRELFWGSFSRSVILPEEVDPEAAEATIQHGLLTIHLPKKKKGVVQKLKVKVT